MKKTKTHTTSYLQRHGVLFMLATIILVQSFFLTVGRGHVLHYATDMSVSGLLSAHNAHRTNNGKIPLTINTKLTQAAQNKANDMINRNYWSHNTPDGLEPWVFITNAGYSYAKAGENLAYGYLTSDSNVNEWMNSPTHKANVLDSSFSQVGFGIVNGESYQGGQYTLVVAMYAQPITDSFVPAPAQVAQPPQQSPPPSSTAEDLTIQATPTEDTSVQSQSEARAEDISAYNTAPGVQPAPEVRRSVIYNLMRGNAPRHYYLIGLTVALALGLVLMRHATAVRRYLTSGETFVFSHPALEVSMAGIALLLLFVSSQSAVL